ncbi:crotonobetainyl-CoA:carnitine CoA-transferase CaiB-like acyl-CoA transferase [Brevibacillus nitrificans]|nr:crotonobetainyl-CoA:carnitine CoA-transferase CaiB-like acyl-CoA transferase [Brevibacillus nitrificans]
MAQGLSGLMSMTGEKNGRPVKNGIAIHDIAAGVTAIYSIMAAYIHKMTTGEGQHIDLSLVDSGLAWTVWESAAYFGAGEVSKANGSAHRVTAPYQGFPTKNGNILVGPGNQKLWEKFCKEVIEKEELIDDPRFLTNSELTANLPELEKIIESVLVQQDSQYWLEKLDAAGVPSSPIYPYDEALNDPHIRSRDMVIEVRASAGGNDSESRISSEIFSDARSDQASCTAARSAYARGLTGAAVFGRDDPTAGGQQGNLIVHCA